MASDESWQLRDLAPEVRETAREAARRSGLSVGQWLQSVIVDSAGKPAHAASQPQAPARPAQQKLDALSEQLARLERSGASPASAQAMNAENEELAARMRSMEGRIATLGKTTTKAAPTQHLTDVLAGLNQKLDRLISAGGEKLRGFGSRAGASQADNAAAVAASNGVALDEWSLDLDQAVAEIVERQRALDSATAPPPTQPPQPAHTARSYVPPPRPAGYANGVVNERPNHAGLTALESQLNQLSDELRILRQPGGFADGMLGLREQLGEVGRTLADAAPRRALQAIETEIHALSERIDDRRRFEGDSTALAGIERSLTEVREALRGMAPAESLAAFRDDVMALDRKIEIAAARGLEAVALAPLQEKVAELRDIATHAASGDALVALAEEVQGLGDKIDRLNPQKFNAELLASLDRRFHDFAAEVNRQDRGQEGGASFDRLVGLVETLSDRIGALDFGRESLPTLEAVMTQLMRLTEHIEISGARMENLDKLERTFNVLLDRMDALRGDTLAAAERVARDAAEQHIASPSLDPSAVEAIRTNLDTLLHSHVQADRRTQDTLEAVHDTLERLVDRLAVVETGIRVDAPRAAPTMRAFEPVRTPEPMRAPTIVPSEKPMAEPSAAEPMAAEASRVLAVAERRAIDPTLPADFPLEPGSRGGSSAAERIAASESALGGKPAAPADAKSNFIAAARRAAQAAANMQAAPEAVQEATRSEPSTLASFAQKFTRRTPLMLVGICTLAGGIALHVSLNGIDTSPVTKLARSVTTFSLAQKPKSTEPAKRDVVVASLGTTQSSSDKPAPPSPPQPTSSEPAAKPPSPQFAATAPAVTRMPISPEDVTGAIPQPKPQSGARMMPTVSPLTIATISLPTGDVTGSIGRATGLSAKPPVDAKPAVPTTQGTLPERLRAAAAAGDAGAEYEIALRHAEGRGVPINPEEAARWFERAATRDLAPAQYRLGSLYEKGLGVKKDLDQARRLYRAAGDKGNGKAMHNLAVLYAEGGVDGKPDFKVAAQWFRKAAERGIPDSQFNLGILYARGLGVEQNLAESFKWFALAAKQGDKDAEKKRDDVANRLDQPAIIAARLAVQTFTPEQQPPEAIGVQPPPGGWDAAAPATAARPNAKADPKAKPAPRKLGS